MNANELLKDVEQQNARGIPWSEFIAPAEERVVDFFCAMFTRVHLDYLLSYSYCGETDNDDDCVKHVDIFFQTCTRHFLGGRLNLKFECDRGNVFLTLRDVRDNVLKVSSVPLPIDMNRWDGNEVVEQQLAVMREAIDRKLQDY